MKRVLTTLVASGVLGEFSIEWKVLKQYDEKNDECCFDLYIDSLYITTCSSVLGALKVLVDWFDQ